MLRRNTILVTAGIIIAGVSTVVATLPGRNEMDSSTRPLPIMNSNLALMSDYEGTGPDLDIEACVYYAPYSAVFENNKSKDVQTSAYTQTDEQKENSTTKITLTKDHEVDTMINTEDKTIEQNTMAVQNIVESQPHIPSQTQEYRPDTQVRPDMQVRPEQSTTPYEEPTTKAPVQSGTSNNSYAQQVVDLVNSERAKEGLSPLTYDATLSAAAQKRAEEIVTVFQHTRPDGTQFYSVLKEFGISYRSTGENIAYGQKNASAVMNDWMNSSGHRANIMNSSFEKIGVGVYIAPNGTIYWSQLFLK